MAVGQTSRIDALKQAVEKANKFQIRFSGFGNGI